MSDWNMLIWLTQLGLSVVLPLAGMTGLAIWLCSQYQFQKYAERNGVYGETQEGISFTKG